MNALLDDDDKERTHHERELTLSTGMILGIFAGLVLLCGLFFGFGYKMGSHKPVQSIQPTTAEGSPSPGTNFDTFKPAAGSLPGSSKAVAVARVAPVPTNATDDGSSKAVRPAAATRESLTPASHAAAPIAQEATTVAAGGFIVQIAAVSHQEDAELLVNALRAKGYPVSAHTETQDKFFHIQVGPFSNRKDADAAKQRLVADGYQPIVK